MPYSVFGGVGHCVALADNPQPGFWVSIDQHNHNNAGEAPGLSRCVAARFSMDTQAQPPLATNQ